MAKGDVVSDLQDIASAGNLDYQPAAGVEVLVTSFVAESATSTSAKLYNGTLGNAIFTIGNSLVAAGTTPTPHLQSKILINNTRYLRISNGSGANNELGFTGIQTK